MAEARGNQARLNLPWLLRFSIFVVINSSVWVLGVLKRKKNMDRWLGSVWKLVNGSGVEI